VLRNSSIILREQLQASRSEETDINILIDTSIGLRPGVISRLEVIQTRLSVSFFASELLNHILVNSS